MTAELLFYAFISLLFLVFTLAMGLVRAQQVPSLIDKIQTKEQANDFFEHETFSGKSGLMELYGKKAGQDSLSVSGWFYKLDFDGDGRADLLMNGRMPLVVIDRTPRDYYLDGLGYFGNGIHSTRLVGIDSSHRPARLVVQRFTSTVVHIVDHGGYGSWGLNRRESISGAFM